MTLTRGSARQLRRTATAPAPTAARAPTAPSLAARRAVVGWGRAPSQIAPWALGYGALAARWNDVACGVAIGVLAMARLAGAPRWVWLSLCNAAIASWLVVASLTIDSGGTEFVNDVVVGAVVALLALWSAASSEAAGAAHRAPTAPSGTRPSPGSAARRRSPSPPGGARWASPTSH